MSAPKKFRGYDFTVEDWLALCEMHNHRCASCGEESFLTVDHIKPRAAGGTDALDNIQPLCRSCNTSKGSSHGDKKKERYRDNGIFNGKFTLLLTPEDKYVLSFLESQTGASRTGAVRLALREAFTSRGGTIEAMRDALAKAPKEGS